MEGDSFDDDRTRAASRGARVDRPASIPPSGRVVVVSGGAPIVDASLGGPSSPTSGTLSVGPVSSVGGRSSASGKSTFFSLAGATTGHSKAIGSAREALEQGAVNRLRMYTGAMIGWGLLGIPLIALIPGSTTDRVVCLVSLGILLASYYWMFRRAITPESLRIEETLPVAILQAVGASGISLGAGLVSPFTGLIAVGLILYCLSVPSRHALAIYLVVALSEAVMGLLALLDVTSSTGLLYLADQPKLTTFIDVAFVELVYATAYLVGRLASGDNARLVESLEEVVRTAAHRDALLREARAELDRAAELGGPGQFSGQELGSYRLGDVLGRGGMGEVYEAVRIDDGSLAAVKLLRRDVLADRDIVRRFEREARIVAGLRSPHVVAVYEVGGLDAPLPYIAMERLRGLELVTELRNRGSLPLKEVSILLNEVSAGLDSAHASGIVHRDMKPHNLFLAEAGGGKRLWKILDFGVSKNLFGEDATLTANQLLGTPHYMAPEQAKGGLDVDHRADIHGLAAIAYRAATGHMPFGKGDVSQVLLAVMHEVPIDPRKHRALPDDVALVLRIGLAKRPQDRFGRASDFARAFADAMEGNLDEAVRAKATSLLAAEPWGSSNARQDPTQR